MRHIQAVTARTLDIAMRKPFGIAGGAQEIAANVLVTLTTDAVTVRARWAKRPLG
jgi:hypothetical protein